jgi:hypothetical protein
VVIQEEKKTDKVGMYTTYLARNDEAEKMEDEAEEVKVAGQ